MMMRFTPMVLLLAGFASSVEAKDNSQVASFLHRMLEEMVSQGDDFLTFDNPPCYPCGPAGFTTTPDHILPIPGPDDEDISCIEVFDLFVSGAVPEGECEMATEFLFSNQMCGCASVPTISPAPTATESMQPSPTPTSSPFPTAGACFLCGTKEAGANISFDSTVVSVPAFGEIPCFILNDILPGFFSSGESEEFGEFSECADFQSLGKECGCLPLEPTISPAPTASMHPSTTPTSSPFPTAAPCFLCGGTDPFNFDMEEYLFDEDGTVKEVDIPGMGVIPCFVLHDMSFFGLPQDMECTVVQAFGKECGCPNLEPTVSPAPTVSPKPSMFPTASPAPTAPCSCEGLCNGHNYECNCWCDSICKNLGDCCGDVADYCVFGDNNGEDGAGEDGLIIESENNGNESENNADDAYGDDMYADEEEDDAFLP